MREKSPDFTEANLGRENVYFFSIVVGRPSFFFFFFNDYYSVFYII